VHFKKGK
jgi:hypothetical protein